MRPLKICLWIAGVFCLLSVFGMFLPVRVLESLAKVFGGQAFPDSPMCLYTLRVVSATYVAVGVFFVISGPAPYGFRSLGTVLGRCCGVLRCGLWDNRTGSGNASSMVPG